ncbi:hypothetical protein [Thiosocius teredinicola]|uniref:hypothetical protein n=1 Tax=Thiosocius teredinicola TaxID=1973002 RepID=UPI000F7666C3
MVNAPNPAPNPGMFNIPGTAVARHPDALLNPRALGRWIDDLPLANPQKSAAMLLQQLRMVVRDPQPGNRFAQLIELFEEPLEKVLALINERLEHSSDSAIPLDQMEHTTIELLTEFANAHLRMANDQIIVGRQPEPETLMRAMTALDLALSIERLHYYRLAPKFWLLLLTIFRHADRQQVGNLPMEAPLRQPDDPNTINGLFFRALIVCACDPNHQVPTDVLAWHHWIGKHAVLLSLSVLPQGAFTIPVDISGAKPPLSCVHAAKPGPEIRYLDIDPLLQAIEEDDDAPPRLLEALSNLIKGRKSPERRAFPRQPRSQPYHLLHGLRVIHEQLSALTQGLAGRDVARGALACLLTDQSKSGAAFRLSGPVSPPLCVGEPVLVQAEGVGPNGAPVGFAGVIKRLVNDGGTHIEIGVEKLLGRLVPVQLIPTAGERGRLDNHALLQQSPTTGKLTLLAGHGVYREGNTLAMESATVRYDVRMRSLLGRSQSTVFIEVELAGG